MDSKLKYLLILQKERTVKEDNINLDLNENRPTNDAVIK